MALPEEEQLHLGGFPTPDPLARFLQETISSCEQLERADFEIKAQLNDLTSIHLRMMNRSVNTAIKLVENSYEDSLKRAQLIQQLETMKVKI